MNHTATPARARVSVCMISYNHEKFIAQAVDSVLAQQGDFDLELVIGDDASKDATAAILAGYAAKHPQIRLRVNSANLGMMGNLQATLDECTGDFIAMLEGDDYWSDPAKLARQVAFMQAHPDFALCFHPVRVEEGGALRADRFTLEVPAVTTIADLAQGNYMHTCAVLYRAGLLDGYPDSFRQSTVGDYFLHMLYARHGKIGKLPETMAVYRVHAGGVWSSHHGIEKKVLRYLECMIGCFDPDIDAILTRRHQQISTRVLLAELGTPDAPDNLARALRFDSGVLLARLADLAAENARLRRGPLQRAAGLLRQALGRRGA